MGAAKMKFLWPLDQTSVKSFTRSRREIDKIRHLFKKIVSEEEFQLENVNSWQFISDRPLLVNERGTGILAKPNAEHDYIRVFYSCIEIMYFDMRSYGLSCLPASLDPVELKKLNESLEAAFKSGSQTMARWAHFAQAHGCIVQFVADMKDGSAVLDNAKGILIGPDGKTWKEEDYVGSFKFNDLKTLGNSSLEEETMKHIVLDWLPHEQRVEYDMGSIKWDAR